MRKITLCIYLAVTGFTLSAQQVRPEPTQFSQNLISVTEQVLVTNSNEYMSGIFNLSDDNKLVLISTLTDDLGYSHHKYQQQYKNLVVEGATVTVHSFRGFVKTISGNFRSFQELSINATKSSAQCLQNALGKIGASQYVWQMANTQPPVGQLLVFNHPVTGAPHLAFKFDIHAIAPLYRAFVFVDANTGEILFENNRIHHTNMPASGASLYNGNVAFTADYNGSIFALKQTSSNIETYNLNNGTDYANAVSFTSTSATNWPDATGVQAHWGAEKTHDYFLNKHSRNSFNGTGGIIKSYVHYATNYVNAFWDGTQMTYGDGNGTTNSALVSLDIVGHEITHGVTEYSANLIYSYESGALNESFSDIFGEAIEKHASGTNNWQMGTEIGIGASGAIRSMNNPNLYSSPDTYHGTFWYNGSADNGGVHYNSGVQNKWFYILSEGETGTNDIGSNYTVTGIGIDKAAKIAYRNLTVYLTNSSNYAAARAGSIQAAIDLYGAGSAEVIATTNAWYAVGVGTAYGTISYCISKSNNSTYEWIAGVEFGSFVNNSGGAGYADFTALTINATPGQTYNVKLTPGYSAGNYNEFWKVWIDYNRDGDFSDAGELVLVGAASPNIVNGFVTIPATVSGSTRMRVSMKYSVQATECETFSYGEVEDYTISFTAPGSTDTQAPTAPTNLTASGTTQNETNLSWDASTDNVGVEDYTVYVAGISVGTTSALSYTVTGLHPATTYSMYVLASDSSGNNSNQSATITETTLSNLDTQAPTAPANLAATNTTQTATNLTWMPSTDNVGVVGYDVLVDGNVVSTTTGTAFNLVGLTPNTNYLVEVSATDAAGNAATSSINVTTLPTVSNTIVLGSYFETSWDNWADGGSDVSRYTGTRSFEGNYSIIIQDNSGAASTTTSPVLNLSGKTQVLLEFNFYANSFENNEDFWVQFYNGSTWTTVATYARGTGFNNNTFYAASVTLSSVNSNLASTSRFRFVCDASANDDQIHIDAVKVIATNPFMFNTPIEPVITLKEIGKVPEADFVEDEFILYPNPASGMLYLNATSVPTQVYIMNVTGQILAVYNQEYGLESFDVSALASGTYVLAIRNGDETVFRKFIKQ